MWGGHSAGYTELHTLWVFQIKGGPKGWQTGVVVGAPTHM